MVMEPLAPEQGQTGRGPTSSTLGASSRRSRSSRGRLPS
ncbi:hypothetical protein BS78_K071200 [Paspalum vaginatum]|uniref:Uncharacterized protein n=1 Tax=Paspalum vaginatum TaxID=158149 RepID=A0A9W8CE41_9POAL|nr:hypothetical protein BS78_K071200 [Paspalum vaginatum]